MFQPRVDDPICNVKWVQAERLSANDYNPNVVYTPELRLLERSILTQGWVQPVLIDAELRIVDGFHRWRLAQDSAAIRARYEGRLPAAVLPLGRADAMLVTVRMNRAKGTHVAIRMSEMVRELLDVHGLDPQQVAEAIGATREEVSLLHQDGVFKAKDIKNWRYSKSWRPVETRRGGGNSAA